MFYPINQHSDSACLAVLRVHSSSAIILMEKRELFVFLVFGNCYSYVALPHGAVGWSAACDCVIPDHTQLLF